MGNVHPHLIDYFFPNFSPQDENLCSVRYGGDEASSLGLLMPDEDDDLGGYEYDVDNFLGNDDSDLEDKRQRREFLRKF